MSHRERMSPVDVTWLRMDRPANLMVIVGVFVMEGPVSLKRFEQQLFERLTSHRRFRQRVEVSGGTVYWRDDERFEISRHMHRVRLPGRGGKQALQHYVAELASEPFDRAHPLWQVHIVEKYADGAAAIIRIHHAIADGIALMKVMMSLADDADSDAEPPRPPDDDEGWIQSLLAPVVAAVDAGKQASGFTLRQAFGLARHPGRAVKYLRAGAGVASELAYLALMPSDSETRFKGEPHGAKRAAWSEPLRLTEVKAVAGVLGCSINDILLSCVAGALGAYLDGKGDVTEGVEVRALVPINLRPPEAELELGNRFGIIAVELPVGIRHPIERLRIVRQRMLELKASYEPPVTLGLFGALGYAPKLVQDQLFDLLLSRATAVMTNVPGPSEPLRIAGSPLRQVLFWVPQSGDIGMGVSILSYAGKVQFGLITDAALVPDPEAIVSRFAGEFERYLYHVLLDPPVAAE